MILPRIRNANRNARQTMEEEHVFQIVLPQCCYTVAGAPNGVSTLRGTIVNLARLCRVPAVNHMLKGELLVFDYGCVGVKGTNGQS